MAHPTGYSNSPLLLALSSIPSTSPTLTEREQKYVDQLKDLDAASILDEGDTEKKVKALGQQIFNEFTKALGHWEKGKQACQNICNALAFCGGSDCRIRKANVEAAWDGIGNNCFRWRR